MTFVARTLALLCLTGSLYASTPSTNLTPQAVRIADFVATDIRFDAETDTTEYVIHAPGASFIKFHFDFFHLPDNAYLLVRNASGSEVYTYGMSSRDGYTYDAELDEDGYERFAAMSVTGDRAVISLESNGALLWQDGDGVYITRYMEGYPNGLIEALTGEPLYEELSTCGVNQRTPVECYAGSYPTEYTRAKAVARLVMSGSLCTAWRVSDDNRMFTNNHCMATSGTVSGSESWFNYQYSSCSSNTTTTPVKVSGNTLLATDFTLDYTLYTVANFSTIAGFGNLGLDVRTPTLHEEIYIPQHGSGNPKELAIEDDQNSTGLCRIDDAVTGGNGTDTDTGYLCDTIGGSSGSPVLARASHKVIALHHFGGCTNQGVRIDKIWPQVATHFGNVIPNGSGGGPGNNPPTAAFTYTTDVLTVALTDGSSDSDGSVVSRAWNFGDGATSTAANPAHTYAASGTYTVTLTVTDDDGATGTTSKSVTVTTGDPGDDELTDEVPVTGISVTQGAWAHYYIDVPEGAVSLDVSMSGGSGDADLYVRQGAQPTTSSYDCRPYTGGNTENCSFTNPGAGRWYVSVRGYNAASGVTLVADFETGGSTCTPYSDTLTDLSAAAGDWLRYTQDVPSCAGNLTVTISGGTGDADLYLRHGAEPTTSSYDCRPYKWGNSETCTVDAPASGTWHIGIRAYNAFNGLTLTASYQ